MNYKLVIDKKCLQVYYHSSEYIEDFKTKQLIRNPSYQNRLQTFLEIIRKPASDITCDVIIDELKEEYLQADCLVFLTRIEPFSESEINMILKFIGDKNKSILLMSNHNPFDQKDNELTTKLGITLTGGYYSGVRGKYTKIDSTCLTDHPILSGKTELKPISSIMTNTTCRIESKFGQPFVYLPASMIGRWSSEGETPIKNRIFGLAIDGETGNHPIIKGKVVILADSGFIGDKGSKIPGFGIIDKEDNELFIKRIFSYLLKK